MKIIRYPRRDTWAELLRRPASDFSQIGEAVRAIVDDVRTNGDQALRRYTSKFDKADPSAIEVSATEFAAARGRVPDELKAAIRRAKSNIERFHASQISSEAAVETEPGVICWRRPAAVERVGLYVPAGTAPLFSTVLMLAVPARLAGCGEVVICTPPDPSGGVADAVLFAAELCGVNRVFKAGGAQAIAAMAYGTETVTAVYKVFGPGNRYVTYAKQLLSTVVAIDMPAGPSEVAVVADETTEPAFAAADLLSQAEHDENSQVLLVSTSDRAAEKIAAEIERQIIELPRRDIAAKAIASSSSIVVGDLDEAMDVVNAYAPEHLILAVDRADELVGKVVNAGSVFVGKYACESVGDYASGTNHTLPTAGFARAFSGVSVESFVKKITFQKLTAEGLKAIGPSVELMAAAEGLDAHRRAVSVRLEKINEL